MSETVTAVITEVGKIIGRNAIYLDKVNIINESTFEIEGEFNGTLCSKLNSKVNKNYKITFNKVCLFKMIEYDFDETDYESSFDLIENSKLISKLIENDKLMLINKIDNTFKHYIFRTYDTVFEIVGKEFSLILY